MIIEGRLTPEIKGDLAMELMRSEIARLYHRQRAMTFKNKVLTFRSFAALTDGGIDAVNYQLSSFEVFSFLHEQKKIDRWLVPEPGMLLTSMWVNKVIITKELETIPVSECFSYSLEKGVREKISELYQRPSHEVMPVLRHTTIGGHRHNRVILLQRIQRMINKSPRQPLVRF